MMAIKKDSEITPSDLKYVIQTYLKDNNISDAEIREMVSAVSGTPNGPISLESKLISPHTFKIYHLSLILKKSLKPYSRDQTQTIIFIINTDYKNKLNKF